MARNTAGILQLDNVSFELGQIENLRFADQSFDGVCFGGNVFTYRSDSEEMLNEISRVLKQDSVFAFEQSPGEPAEPPWERIGWFIDGGPPILHYAAGSGLYSRAYFIYVGPQSELGKRLVHLGRHIAGELSTEQREACEEIKQSIEGGNLGIIGKAIYDGENRSLAAEEFVGMLEDCGFVDVTSWALPDAVAFAKSLRRNGVLSRLLPDDLVPSLRALVESALTCPGWVHAWVTCRAE